ncbi:thioesterase family protein [Gammaproteobacteria bacterium]|nr:thioesterase family protein [Gammaproteobacteria bacterium]
MKNLFPYVGKEVIVTQEMCDFNGHMNVNHIKAVFEQGWEFTSEDFGFNDEYLQSGFSSFTLEDSYRFQKEFLLGDKIFPAFRLFNVNTKLFHMIGALFDQDSAICAMYETVEGHIDMSKRRMSPMDAKRLERVLAVKQAHDSQGPVPYDVRLKIKDL